MYAIAQVIYGIPLDIDFDNYYSDIENEFHESGQDYERLLENHFENCTPGFLSYYSGSSINIPRAFGVQIDKFNGYQTVKVSKLKLVATQEVKQEYEQMLESLDIQTQREIKTFGDPHIFLLWSTS